MVLLLGSAALLASLVADLRHEHAVLPDDWGAEAARALRVRQRVLHDMTIMLTDIVAWAVLQRVKLRRTVFLLKLRNSMTIANCDMNGSFIGEVLVGRKTMKDYLRNTWLQM